MASSFCCSSVATCNAFQSCTEIGLCTEVSAKALLIEDDEIISGYLKHVLNQAGCCVICAEDAELGLKLFSEYYKKLDFVIMDYQLPGMHAARLISRIRDISLNVHVILASGYTEEFIKDDFPLNLVTSFIQKPFEAESLLNLIATTCTNKRA